jgi:polyketide synthase PksJ
VNIKLFKFTGISKIEIKQNGTTNLCGLFEQQVKANPDAIAGIFQEKSITYKELDDLSSRLADFLRAEGAKAEAIVALSIHNSLHLLVAILGILRSGGVYLPIDPNYPPERIESMLENAKPLLVLTEESLLDKFSTLSCKTFLINEIPSVDRPGPMEPIQLNHLAYVVFTSGSTGKPKGILIEHKALSHAIFAHRKLHPQNLVSLVAGSISFDASIIVIALTLSSGGTVCIPKSERFVDPEQIVNLIEKHAINYTLCIPSFYSMLLNKSRPLSCLQSVDLGGENIPNTIPDLHRKLAPNAILYNMYGPSEYSVGATFAKIYDPDAKQVHKITIGKALSNTQVYILDENFQQAPVDVKGEIFIGGDGLATGYLNNETLSAEKFIHAPLEGQKAIRLYRTGDFGRFLPDGNIEFLGRIDHQVKIHGYRIEIGEIEGTICRYPEVDEAVVIVREDLDGRKRMVAYFTARANHRISEKLRIHLLGALPQYMIPSTFIQVDQFSRTPNGKIDRKVLADIPEPKNSGCAIRSTTLLDSPLAEELLDIWKKILDCETVGIDDNFFDLGGDSISLAGVQTAIEKNLGLKIPVIELFQYPTISQLIRHFNSQKKIVREPTKNVEKTEDAIAIIGMSGKFPGAKNIDGFWPNLCQGVESISTFSAEELRNSGVSEKTINSPNYVRSKGILDEVELFDADFFGINAKEAQLTDPQHRLFLECAWEALENAGYCPDRCPGAVGVYGGSGTSSYYMNNIYPNRELRESLGDFFLHISNDKDFLTTKVSYKLNLKGPSMAIQTACSTSLVAICTACNHLLSHQCDMALAGGSSISVPQSTGYLFQEGMILSPDGRCRPFDAEARGTVLSNGVGIVVLKRLQDAIKDKDHIFAVIRGYGLNNDGSEKIGYSAPSVEGQAEVISAAIAMSGIDPGTIGYAEAHGTGTILGDPIEIKGLAQAFRSTKKSYCALGSVKGNIGHAVEAAGVIGLMKAALSLYHKKIPPLIHFTKPNPHIDFAESPFYINPALKEWEETDEHPRRACVSSFGIGGTNAHVILEEWQGKSDSVESPGSSYPLVLSAKTLAALKTAAKNLGQYLQDHHGVSLVDVAYTLQVGRKSFEHTRTLICRNREEAISALLNFDPANYPEHPQHKIEEGRRVPLPTYPFEKKRHWIDTPSKTEIEIAPSNRQHHSIEAELIAIWKDLLGEESIGIHDDFFQLGGDSLLSIQVMASILKHFSVRLGAHVLLEHSTIAKLAKIISEHKPSMSPLVKLRTGSGDKPLFLIHPIEGNLFCYKGLIDTLVYEQPLYGFQAIGTESKTIEEIASYYIEELRNVQPNGPYHLLGMSFGGIIAYEMARQLKANGASIGLLCMVDVAKPEPALMPLTNDDSMLAYLLELLEGKPVSAEEFSSERLIQSLKLGAFSQEQQRAALLRIKSHLQALAGYSPKPYDGKILFFQAETRFFRLKNICLGSSWKELASGEVEIQEIPGNHLSIMAQPQIRTLADLLGDHLKIPN